MNWEAPPFLTGDETCAQPGIRELFYEQCPDGVGGQEDAKLRETLIAACLLCPSRRPCAEWATRRPQEIGVWGGMTWEQRRQARISRARGTVRERRCAHCQSPLDPSGPSGAFCCEQCRRRGSTIGPLPVRRHGRDGYAEGCRCDPCEQANVARHQAECDRVRARRARERVPS